MNSLIKIHVADTNSHVYINPLNIGYVEITDKYQPIICIYGKMITCTAFKSMKEAENWLIREKLIEKVAIKPNETSNGSERFKGDRFV